MILTIVGATLTWWTWMKWADPIIDYGTQLYAPWRISEGDVFVRDIQTLYGPLSAYVNAIIFKLLGVSMRSLVLANLAVVAALVAMIYFLVAKTAGRWIATTAGVVFLIMFGFAHYLSVGNFNYICPYAHETTHALLLGIATLLLLRRFAGTGGLVALGCAGFLTGLGLLTKPEISLAQLAACCVGLPLILYVRRMTCVQVVRAIAVAGTALATPVLISITLFAMAVPAGDAVLYTFNAWRYLGKSSVTGLAFFQEMMGLDDIAGNLRAIALQSVIYALLLSLAGIVGVSIRTSRHGPNEKRSEHSAAFLLLVGSFWFVWNLWDNSHPPLGAQPLPLFMFVLATWTFLRAISNRRSRNLPAAHRYSTYCICAVFSFVLMGRQVLYARFAHYGFALVMPATIILLVLLLHFFPSILKERFGASPRVFRAAAIGMIAACTIKAAILSNSHYAAKVNAIGAGPDRFFGDSRATIMSAVLEEVETRIQPGQTLVVLPEGVMLNYLARVPLSNPCVTLIPGAYFAYEPGEVVRIFQSRPPDCLILMDRDTSDQGFELILRDYAQDLGAWIRANYHLVHLIGENPFANRGQHGVLILRKN